MTQNKTDTAELTAPEICFLCKSADYNVFYDTSPFRTVKCSSCGLARVMPMPDEKQRQAVNTSTYSTEEYRDRYFKDRKNFTRWFRDKLKLIETYKPQKGRILDIGCSYGFFVEEALRRGWDACGCEINPVTGGHSRERLKERVCVGDLDAMSFTGAGFDVITLWDVLEHQPDPSAFLSRVKKYLKEDGIICLQVPNFDGYISRLKGKNWDWLTPGDHLYFFTPATLAKTAESAGFVQSYFETWEPTRYFIDSLIGLNGSQGAAAELYRSTVVRFVRLVLFFVFLPFQLRLHKKGEGALLLSILKRRRGQDA